MNRFFAFLLIAAVMTSGLWAGGLAWFTSQIPGTAAARYGKVDAIVVLTGSNDRLREGIRLLQNGVAERLFISGAGSGVRVGDIYALAEEGGVRGRIDLGHDAKDTRGNALETARWMKERRRTSLLLVTSDYHMARSLLEFGAAMPDIVIAPYPVASEKIPAKGWWRAADARRFIIGEYHKYLGTAARIFLERSVPGLWAGLS